MIKNKECCRIDIILTIKEISSQKLHYHNAPGGFNLEIFFGNYHYSNTVIFTLLNTVI